MYASMGEYVMPFEDRPQSSTTPARLPSGLGRRVYFGIVMASGTAVLCWSAIEIISRPPGPLWLALAALTAVCSAAAFRMPGFPVSFSLSDTFTIIGTLLFGPSAGALLVALDALVLSWRFRVSTFTLERVVFNVTALALAMWLAAQLFFAIVGRGPLATEPAASGRILVPLAVFASAYFVLNTGLIAGAVAIGRQAAFYQVWREHFLPLWLTHFGGTSIAGLLLLLRAAGLANLTTFALGLPLVLVLLVAVLTGIERLRQRSADFAKLRSYAAALRSTADGVVLTNVDEQITFMNPVAERLTGWTAAQARGRKIDEVLQLERMPGMDADDASPEGNPDEPGIRECMLVRQDGSTCPIEQTHAYVRDEDGDVAGVIRTFRDITQRKAVESEHRVLLRRQQEARAAADEANRSKDEFLATLSHELRTPMASIIGWVQLLRTGRMDAERTQQALASLERGARAQAAVVSDLLDISRIMRGNLRLDVRRTNLSSVLHEAIETVESAVQAKDLTLRLDVADDVSTIDADPDRLRQVFWNLLSNSVKFTPPGGSVHVEAHRQGDTVRVDVIDTGSGIDPSFLPFVFDRFRQQDGSAARDHGGLGLGLAIVNELVELHGGSVEARSEGAGRGSRFVVCLPATVRVRESDATPVQLA
jgi:PAS domain S-box-containing protein